MKRQKYLKTSTIFLSWEQRRKERKKRKIFFKTNVVLVPKIAVVRKEEGATAAASHLPSPRRNSAGWSRKGRTGRDSPRRFILQERPIKYHKCPTFDTKRRRFLEFNWLALQNRRNKYKMQNESEKAD